MHAIDTLEAPATQLTWPETVAEYERAVAAEAAASEVHDKAHDAAEAEAPEPRDFWALALRGEITRSAALVSLIEQLAVNLSITAAKGSPKSESEIDEAYAALPVVAKEYVEWRTAREEAHKRHLTDELEKAWEATLDTVRDAYDRVISTPAPDAAAMLYKLGLLIADMREACVEDTDRVAAIRDDARRLLGRE